MNFSNEIVAQVWSGAQTVAGFNPNIWRKDFAGAWIRRDLYGIKNDYGWEIDHKKPIAKGGTDKLDNLWAMHWKNNRGKGDDYPTFKTYITSRAGKNVEGIQSWTWKKG